MSVSPRETRLILLAMNTYNELLQSGERMMTAETQERWDEILEYVQEISLKYGA